ncbi:MAG: efflux RND transporter periplasmic adaptor subunit [Microvirga sp.]|nr:efflux RND transporter periplasmic adaptor subunit [Microvirga sp.]
MPVWKQILAAVVVFALSLGAWALVAPDSLPGPARDAAQRIGLLSSEPASGDAGAGPAQGRGPGGPPGGFGGAPGGNLVVAATVTEVASNRRVQAVGTAEAMRSVTLFAPTAGLVTEVLFEAGSYVEEGQPLLRLDAREEEINVEKAQIELQRRRDQFTRFEQLSQTQAVSIVQVDEARAAADSAAAELRSVELALERRTLRAPFAGHMGLAQVSVGDRVTTTTNVANIDDRRTIMVRYPVPERFAAQARPGARMEATTISFGAEIFQGSIAEIDTRIDPQARTLTIRAAVDNSDDRLRPGMAFLVRTNFVGETHAAVPLLALQWDRDGAYVWRVHDGVVRRIDVDVVERGDASALIAGEIAAGDQIVVEGVQRLRDGSGVTVVVAENETRERS